MTKNKLLKTGFEIEVHQVVDFSRILQCDLQSSFRGESVHAILFMGHSIIDEVIEHSCLCLVPTSNKYVFGVK